MAIRAAFAPGPRPTAPNPGAALAALALGLRFIVLAVIAGSGVLLLHSPISRLHLAAGIVASALLGVGQSALALRRPTLPGEPLVPAQVAVWIYLLHVSGGQHSPLFIGLLLEVPLSGALLGRRGCVLAAIAAAGAYLAYAVASHRPLELDVIPLVTGLIGVAALLTWMLLEILERQRAAILAARSALSVRAESLATELRLLGDYLGSALLSVDDMGRLASVNLAGAALLGFEGQAAMGHPWQEVLRPDPPTAGRLARTLAEGETQRDVPIVFHRGDGAPVALRGDLWMSPAPDGRRMHLLLEAPHRTDAADDPLHRMGEAAACIAHQFKNSLQALGSLVHQAERADSDRDSALGAQRLQVALRTLGELTDDVLAVAGAARPCREELQLTQVVSSALLLARPGAVRVTVDPTTAELRVWASRGRLVHALYNLIDNACRATPPGGEVHVHMERVDGCAHVDIVDGGPGLPPGVDGSGGPVPSHEGSGLGLVAARRFLESGGCALTFARAPHGGTLCRITLPITASEPVARSGTVRA